MFQTKVVEKMKIHVLCSATFPENRTVFDIMWKNLVEPDTSEMLRRMCFACWITKDTDTNSEYVILITFPTAKMITRTRPKVTFIHTSSVLLRLLSS